MKRLLTSCLCLGLLLPAAAAYTAPQDSPPPLETVALSTRGIERDLRTYGITAGSLKEAMGERLERAGVKVVDESGLARQPGAGVVTLRLSLTRTPYYFYSYNLNLRLNSRLPLSADNRSYTTVKTWSATRNGMLMPRDSGDIKKIALELLEELLRDSGRGDQ